jgi:hypothetical protein
MDQQMRANMSPYMLMLFWLRVVVAARGGGCIPKLFVTVAFNGC